MSVFRKYHFFKEVFFIGLFFFSIFLLVCVLAPEYCGRLGQWFVTILNNCWGAAAFVIPFSLFGFVVSTFCKDTRCWLNGVAILIIVLSIDVFLSLFFPNEFGQVGYFLGKSIEAAGGKIGAILFLSLFFVSALQCLFGYSITNVIKTRYSKYKCFKDELYVESKLMAPITSMSISSHSANVASLDRSFRPSGMAVDIESCLASYGVVDTHVTDQEKGPVITRYYLQLPRGTRSNVVANLDQDIARYLAVPSCRVLEQIDGRTEIALELPNEKRETVHFKDIVDSEAYQQAQSPVTLVLGKNVSGDPVVGDLSQLPHVLVAGTTGSGKSMCLQSIILGLILKSTPDNLRLILIDPKQLEFNHFNGAGHMLMPVVTDINEATKALNWCVNEMERRYRLMANLGVRDLIGFNKKTADILPRLVIVIDEFADLIMSNRDVENSIVRIAQKSRACGIHLVLSTQRPCANVITGLIKANIPARIAFKTASKNDSRIILDQSGSEQLLGQGDMLISKGNQLQRVHGCYLSDDDIRQSLLTTRKKYREPQYLDLSDFAEKTNNIDALFNEALTLVKQKGRASIRLLQRHFKIGYTRASRIIDEMERQKFITPPDSENQRMILV